MIRRSQKLGLLATAAVVQLFSIAEAPARVVRTASLSIGTNGQRASIARARLRVPSPDGRRIAEIRVHGRAGEALWLDGARVWSGSAATAITSGLVWSKRGDALAFVSKERSEVELVVVFAPERSPAQTMSWAIPSAAGPLRVITWLGDARVGVGPAALEPRVIASWK